MCLSVFGGLKRNFPLDMLEHLFGSKTRLKLLRLFFRDAARSYYVRELTRLVDVQINAVRRELELLVRSGLVKEIKDTSGKNKKNIGSALRKYYALNPESILYPELDALLIKAQALGEQQFVGELKDKAGNVQLILLTGRFTNDKRAPSDMLLVGDDMNDISIDRLVKKYEQELGVELNYTLMTVQEFHDRRHVMDKFLFSLFEARHVKIIDTLGV